MTWLIALIALNGLLGATAQARAQVQLDRETLESRVLDLRQDLVVTGSDPSLCDPAAQWFNWPNWNNWNNWANWANWFNR